MKKDILKSKRKHGGKLIWHRLFLLVCFAVLSFLYILPLALEGTLILGEDTRFHLNRIIEITNHFRQGDFRPYMYTWSFGRTNDPLGIFYPEFTLYPFAFFILLLRGNIRGIYAGFVFYNFLNLCLMYLCVRRMDGTRIQAFLSAVMYTFCTYRFIDAFTRFAMGEFLSMVFLPLVLYGLYAILFGEKRDWHFLAAGMTLLLYSHVLTPFLVILIAFPVILASLFFMKDRPARIGRLLLATLTTLPAASVFLIPLGEQYLYQNYEQPSPYILSEQMLTKKEFILSSLRNSFLDSTQNIYNIGIMLLFTIAAWILLWRTESVRTRVIGFLGTAAALAATNLFPWGLVQSTPIRVIQFPWRLFTIASLFLSYTFGALSDSLLSVISRKLCVRTKRHNCSKKPVSRCPEKNLFYGTEREKSGAEKTLYRGREETLNRMYAFRRRVKFIGMVLLTVAILIPFFQSEKRYIRYGSENHTQYTEATDVLADDGGHQEDYTPAEALSYIEDIRQHTAIVSGVRITLRENEILASSNEQIFKSTALENSESVDLPAAMYANLHVYQTQEDNTRTELETETGSRGTILIHKTGKGSLSVIYEPSFADWLSIVISVIGWGVILVRAFSCSENLSRDSFARTL